MEQNIKIFISCHKKFQIPKCDLLYPIQVGCAFNKNIDGYLHDNDGENISLKNKKYCELTAQYYAWKNIDADYYGFFHYRRYLDFSDKKHKQNFLHEVVVDNFSNFEQEFGYNSENIKNIITQYDVILPCKQFNLQNSFQYAYPCTQDKKDLKFCVEYIYKHFPDMKKATKKFLRGNKAFMCNMFIMKKDLFQNYCAWLFEVLQAQEQFNPHTHSDVQTYRVSGYLAERLLNIYILYLQQDKNIKIKQLPKVFINDPSYVSEKTSKTHAVVIPFDKNYLAQASTLVQSIIDTNQKCEIVVATKDIQAEFVANIKNQAVGSEVNIQDVAIKDCESFEQFLLNVPKMFYNYKYVTVITPNCIATSNFVIENCNSAISGVVDVDEVYKAVKSKKYFRYICKKGLDVYKILSSNYLNINIELFEKNTKILTKKCNFIDILVSNLNNYEILPQISMYKFNSLFLRNRKLNAYIPYYLYNEYNGAQKNAKLICFDGDYPPTTYPLANCGVEYFKIARKTPFYELMIYNLAHNKPSFKEKRYLKRRNFIDKHYSGNVRLFLRTIWKKYY